MAPMAIRTGRIREPQGGRQSGLTCRIESYARSVAEGERADRGDAAGSRQPGSRTAVTQGDVCAFM